MALPFTASMLRTPNKSLLTAAMFLRSALGNSHVPSTCTLLATGCRWVFKRP